MLVLKTFVSITKIVNVDSFSSVFKNTHTMSNLECDKWFNKGYNDEMDDVFKKNENDKNVSSFSFSYNPTHFKYP
jgi:hypothetical protein